jgi:Tol biopolymer transport system component
VFVRDRVAGTTERVSVSSGGEQADRFGSGSRNPVISADGRFVAFLSEAANLVAGDTSPRDVYVRDRLAGTTERVSVSSTNAVSAKDTNDPAISADGRFVAFVTDASNLVDDDTNRSLDVFVRDRVAGTTERVSVNSAGAQANSASIDPAISADGRFIAFESGASNLVAGGTNGAHPDIFVRDRLAGTTERVDVSSRGEETNAVATGSAAISADGRFVAFQSLASNLVPGDTNNAVDVFVRDRIAGTTERVSVSSAGVQGNAHSMSPTISANGRFVTFESGASNLIADDTNRQGDVFVRDRVRGTTTLISASPPTRITIRMTVLLGARSRKAGCRLGPLPDRHCSPGAYDSGLTKAVLCSRSFHTSTIRNVPYSQKYEVEREYGLAPKHYGRTLEIDHIVSLELGGSNDIANLSPERLDAHPGYRVKDKLENKLHDLVCEGKMTLQAAQQQIAGNWIKLYAKVYGSAPAG